MTHHDPFASSIPSSLKTESVALADLHADPANARKHNAKNLQSIQDSLREFGQVEPLVVQADTGKVVGGNGRLEAMRKMGWKTATVVRVSLNATQATALSIALNRTGELAEWDMGILDRHIAALQLDGFDIGSLHFDFDSLGNAIQDRSNEDTDEDICPSRSTLPGVAPEDPSLDIVPEVKTVNVNTGEMWRLGDHYLFCGDSQNNDNIRRLTSGHNVDLVFTDPPYGMNLNTDFSQMHTGGAHQAGTYSKVIGDNAAYSPQHIFDSFPSVPEIILWGADYYCQDLPRDGSWYCWDKRCDEQMDKAIGNVMELAWSKKKHKREVARILWSGHMGMHHEDQRFRIHPTQKPVQLVRWFLNRIKGSVIVDLFAGSGSTIIGCEKEGKTCLAIEMDLNYCQAIIDRWENLTGKEAVLVSERSAD